MRLEGRELHTESIVLPGFEKNHTLLSCDFIKDIAAAIIAPFQHSYFMDEPEFRLLDPSCLSSRTITDVSKQSAQNLNNSEL